MKKTRQLSAVKYSRISMPVTLVLLDLCFLAAHVFFLIFFRIQGVPEMFWFNYFSIAVYAGMLPCIVKAPDHVLLFSTVTMLEVLVHAGVATLFIGWPSGFPLFIICCAPFPFFLPYKRDIVAYLAELLIMAEFIALRIITASADGVVYTDLPDSTLRRLFMYNGIVSFWMIIVFSTIYKRSKQFDRLKLKAKNESLSMLAKIDPLSQLFNRRAMVDFLKQIEQHAKESGVEYALAMADLDDFKHVNDTYGHSAGDTVITAIAGIMTEEVPSEGYVCRWGGEELLFAVPEAGADKGREIAERIRKRLSERSFTSAEGEEFSVTITFGVCGCDGSIPYERYLSIADKYLYYGKKLGKNRVVCESDYLPEE